MAHRAARIIQSASSEARRARRWLGRVLLLLALSSPGRVAAAERERVALELAPSLGDDSIERLGSAIGGQLSDLASVERVAADGPRRVLCRVRIDRTAQGLTVRFTGPTGDALADTRMLADAPAELAASEVASVVRAVVVALLERKDRGDANRASEAQLVAAAKTDAPEQPARETSETPSAPVAELPTPGPTPVPALPSPRRVLPSPGRVWLTALYSGNSYAPELLWQSGARLEAALRLQRFLYAGVGYSVHPPVTVQSAVAVPGAFGLRVLDHGPSLLAGVARTRPRLVLAAELVVGLTKTYRHTTSVAGGFNTTPDSERWSRQLGLRLRARARAPFWPRIWLELAPALELSNTGPSAVMSDTEQVVLSPNTLRFRLDVGASFDVL